ncbi:MAG: hypothetical protein HC896_12020 [Bacteroidales bacterium]|nr:hypothetical protein [Bacteroidales bacterium]
MRTINLLFTALATLALNVNMLAQSGHLVNKVDTCTGYVFNSQYCIDVKPVVMVATPIEVDGDAADWASIPVAYKPTIEYGATGMPANPNDYTVSLKVAWDLDNLYLLLDVKDDDLQLDDADPAQNRAWRKDGIEFATFLCPADSSRYGTDGGAIYSKYPQSQWGISDATTNGKNKPFNYFDPTWAAKHYVVPDLSGGDFAKAGHNYFDWDTVTESLIYDTQVRDFTGYKSQMANKTGGYYVEASMSWDFLNGYNTFAFGGPEYDKPMPIEKNQMITYWLQFNDNDDTERSIIGTTPGGWTQINPQNSIFILADENGDFSLGTNPTINVEE